MLLGLDRSLYTYSFRELRIHYFYSIQYLQEKFENVKGVIRRCKPNQDRLYNGPKKRRDKMTNNDLQNATLVHAVYFIFYSSSNVSFFISIAKCESTHKHVQHSRLYIEHSISFSYIYEHYILFCIITDVQCTFKQIS